MFNLVFGKGRLDVRASDSEAFCWGYYKNGFLGGSWMIEQIGKPGNMARQGKALRYIAHTNEQGLSPRDRVSVN